MYDVLLKRVVMTQAKDAFELVDRIAQRGYKPNQRILVQARGILDGLNSWSQSGRGGLKQTGTTRILKSMSGEVIIV